MANPLKKIYQIIRLRQHYHRHGKNAYIVLLSDEFEKEIQYFGFTGHSIVIPNGIQIERVGFCPPQKKSKIFTFLCFGGRSDDKGLDILLQSITLLAKENVNFVLNVTEGVDTNAVIKSILGESVPKQIHIIPQTDDITDLYHHADCFISASRRETFSYAIAEAMLAGLPVLSSDIDGVKWALTQQSVIPFQSENVEDLLQVMEKMINQEYDLSVEILKKSREYVVNNYSVDIWSEKIISFYNQILGE